MDPLGAPPTKLHLPVSAQTDRTRHAKPSADVWSNRHAHIRVAGSEREHSPKSSDHPHPARAGADGGRRVRLPICHQRCASGRRLRPPHDPRLRRPLQHSGRRGGGSRRRPRLEAHPAVRVAAAARRRAGGGGERGGPPARAPQEVRKIRLPREPARPRTGTRGADKGLARCPACPFHSLSFQYSISFLSQSLSLCQLLFLYTYRFACSFGVFILVFPFNCSDFVRRPSFLFV